jgi:hypothetical protein
VISSLRSVFFRKELYQILVFQFAMNNVGKKG